MDREGGEHKRRSGRQIDGQPCVALGPQRNLDFMSDGDGAGRENKGRL